MDGTFNALGNSDRATAVIGRAIRLCLINLFDVRLGGIDRSTLGHPGKFSFCVAEDEEGSPWEPLATARGVPEGASAVTVMAAGAPRQIMNEWTTDPEEILETFAAEIRANMRQYSIWPGHYAIIVPRQLREHLAAEGFSRADVGRRLYERARIRRREWTEVGKGRVVRDRGDKEYRALPDPEHLLLVAAGGFGAVIPPWFGVLRHRTKQRAAQRRGSDVHLEVIGTPEAAGIVVDSVDDLDQERRFQEFQIAFGVPARLANLVRGFLNREPGIERLVKRDVRQPSPAPDRIASRIVRIGWRQAVPSLRN